MIRTPSVVAVIAGLAMAAAAPAGELTLEPKASAPPLAKEPWTFKLSMPLWATWMQGEAGFHGRTASLDLGPGDLIPRMDMAVNVRAEAHKGRFTVMGEFLHLSLSDGVGTNTVVKKMDLRMDQTMADVGVAWRVIESPRGYLDVTGGVRYTNLYQRLTLQASDDHIDRLAGKLAAVGTAAQVAKALRALEGRDPSIPGAPIGDGAIAKIAKAVKHLKGSTAERKKKIAEMLRSALNRTVSRTDDWLDPYIGLRGRYNLNQTFYLTAKGDIGGFTVGSEFTWQAEAALGCQLSRHLFAEIGYRALGVDYRKDGLIMDTITHGVQMTAGVNF